MTTIKHKRSGKEFSVEKTIIEELRNHPILGSKYILPTKAKKTTTAPVGVKKNKAEASEKKEESKN